MKTKANITDAFEAKVAAAGAAVGSAGEIVNASPKRSPRYALFHGANSICSQKVRCVLAYHDMPYVSHPMNMFLGQTYLPDYVRLRMIGCHDVGGALVAHHSGSTSAAAGCDGAVVPTLIDRDNGAVIVDSKRICLNLDDTMPSEMGLRPTRFADAIDHELAVVDDLPNYQMLMGRRIAAESAETKGDVGASFSQRKVAWCDRYLAEHADDVPLVQAYTAKRAKELSAATELFSSEAMAAAYARAEAALVELERKVAGRTGSWLFGDGVTMADLFWGIELLRMKNTGIAAYWEAGRLPRVQQFAEATAQLPAIRSAVIDWPGAMF